MRIRKKLGCSTLYISAQFGQVLAFAKVHNHLVSLTPLLTRPANAETFAFGAVQRRVVAVERDSRVSSNHH